jgi:hypothetical protein
MIVLGMRLSFPRGMDGMKSPEGVLSPSENGVSSWRGAQEFRILNQRTVPSRIADSHMVLLFSDPEWLLHGP